MMYSKEVIKNQITQEISKSRLNEQFKFKLYNRIDWLFGQYYDNQSKKSERRKFRGRETIGIIYESSLKLNVKFRILKMLDELFRDHLGIIYLNSEELEERDLLRRSMF